IRRRSQLVELWNPIAVAIVPGSDVLRTTDGSWRLACEQRIDVGGKIRRLGRNVAARAPLDCGLPVAKDVPDPADPRREVLPVRHVPDLVVVPRRHVPAGRRLLRIDLAAEIVEAQT